MTSPIQPIPDPQPAKVLKHVKAAQQDVTALDPVEAPEGAAQVAPEVVKLVVA